MITRDRAYLEGDGTPDMAMLRSVLEEFADVQTRLEELRDMYTLKHAIQHRVMGKGVPNIKLVHDIPGYMVAISSGYLLGEPVAYRDETQEDALEALRMAYSRADMDSVDAELAVDAAVYGRGVSLCYADGQGNPRAAQVSPVGAVVVYEDTVEHSPLFGVIVGDRRDSRGQVTGKRVTVYTDTQMVTYEGRGITTLAETGRAPHYFGSVPLIEYWNNAQECGDFERVKSLIDAYDQLQSDRVNNKQQLVDALLLLVGVTGVGEPEDPNDKRTPAQRLREDKLLAMPDTGADAKFLCQEMHEADIQVLRDALAADIHKLSMVPDLTDEHFAANASGVAMRYKLFGLEQLIHIKERWFREGLRARLRLFAHFLAIRGNRALDPDTVRIQLKRSLPVNELEAAQIVQTLQGLVPEELLLGQVPFVEDVEGAIEMLRKQRAEAMAAGQEAFGAYRDANESEKE